MLAVVEQCSLGHAGKHTVPHQRAAADNVDTSRMDGLMSGTFRTGHIEEPIIDGERGFEVHAHTVHSHMIVFGQSLSYASCRQAHVGMPR